MTGPEAGHAAGVGARLARSEPQAGSLKSRSR